MGQGILENTIFAMVKCDLQGPDNRKKNFERFPHLFKNVQIPLNKEIIEEHIFSNFRHLWKGMVTLTTMFQKCLTTMFQKCLKCTNIEFLLEYNLLCFNGL